MASRTEITQWIYNGIQEVNTYIGLIHNFLRIYKASKQYPQSRVLKHIFNSQYINLRSTTHRWKFAKTLYKDKKVREKFESDLQQRKKKV